MRRRFSIELGSVWARLPSIFQRLMVGLRRALSSQPKVNVPLAPPPFRSSVFNEQLTNALSRLGVQIAEQQKLSATVDFVVVEMGRLPASAVVQAALDVSYLAGLYFWESRSEYLGTDGYAFPPPANERLAQLETTPGLEFIFLFHGNGYLREAALRKIDGPVSSPFWVAALAYRLNDWVLPVRRAAFDCAVRVFAKTEPGVIATAAMYLMKQKSFWRRGAAESVVLDETLARADVIASLVDLLLRTVTGTPAQVLMTVSRDAQLDPFLLSLSSNAVNPGVRSVALRALIENRAKWREGFEKQWIDKSFARYRRSPRFGYRPLTVQFPLLSLIEQGSSDKSAQVRKIAMQGLVDNPSLWPEASAIIDRFLRDKCVAVRQGAEYIARVQDKA